MIENIQTKTRYEMSVDVFGNNDFILLAIYVEDRQKPRKSDTERHYHANYFVRKVATGEEFWVGLCRVPESELLHYVNC